MAVNTLIEKKGNGGICKKLRVAATEEKLQTEDVENDLRLFGYNRDHVR